MESFLYNVYEQMKEKEQSASVQQFHERLSYENNNLELEGQTKKVRSELSEWGERVHTYFEIPVGKKMYKNRTNKKSTFE